MPSIACKIRNEMIMAKITKANVPTIMAGNLNYWANNKRKSWYLPKITNFIFCEEKALLCITPMLANRLKFK